MRALELHLRVLENATLIQLHSRQSVQGFYEKLGYHPVGAPFTEIGLPHILMRKATTADLQPSIIPSLEEKKFD
jgi:predicted GNAT family N-acyltransferase